MTLSLTNDEVQVLLKRYIELEFGVPKDKVTTEYDYMGTLTISTDETAYRHEQEEADKKDKHSTFACLAQWEWDEMVKMRPDAVEHIRQLMTGRL